jgi:hypothetical protein
MKDDEVIPFLLTLRHPTFFTLDWDYFERGLCHARCCLAYLDVGRDETAVFSSDDNQSVRQGGVGGDGRRPIYQAFFQTVRG